MYSREYLYLTSKTFYKHFFQDITLVVSYAISKLLHGRIYHLVLLHIIYPPQQHLLIAIKYVYLNCVHSQFLTKEPSGP